MPALNCSRKARLASLPWCLALMLCGHSRADVAAPAPAPAPDWSQTGNVSLVSDYVFRGVSQTQGKPTAQATLDFSHVSGAYLGLFGSGVSNAAYNNGGGAEIDLYGGYRHTLGENRNIDIGLVSYWYPGAHYSGAGRDIRYHTQDLKLGWNEGAVNVYAWYTVSKHWFGFAIDPANNQYVDTGGTTYVEVNWNPEIAPDLVLNLHAGRQNIRHLSQFNYADIKVGLTKTWGSWALFAGASHNDGAASRNGLPYWTFFDADGSSKNVVGTRYQVTMARNF